MVEVHGHIWMIASTAELIDFTERTPNRAAPTKLPAHRTTAAMKTSIKVRIRAEVLTVIGLIGTGFWRGVCIDLIMAQASPRAADHVE